MADLEKTIQVVFKGVDQMAGAVDSVGTGIDKFATKVNSATQPLADLTEKIVLTEGALAALAIAGLALATTKAGEFGDAFSEISTLIEIPAESLDGFRQDILDYARDSTQSIESINQSVYDAISAGASYDESLKALRASEILAVATKADLNSTINLLVPTLNAYGKSMGDASDYSDILFTTVKTGKVTLPELSSSLAQVTGVAAAAGIDFDKLGAAIAATTAYGLPASQAITGLKAAISNIIKPSGEAEKMAVKLGISFNAEAIEAKGLEGVFKEVYTATGGNITQMGKLFGSVEGLNVALTLGKDVNGKYAGALQSMEERAGAALTAFQKMEAGFKNVNQNLINNIQATLIDLGEPLLDDWGRIAASFADVFKGVSVGIEAGAFDPLFDYLEGMSIELSEFFTDLGASMPAALEMVDWDGFLKSIDSVIIELIGLFEAFFGEVDPKDPEDVAAAFQKVVDAITALNNIVSGILKSFKPFIEILGDFVEEAGKSEESTQKMVGEFLGWATQLNKVTGLLGGLTGAMHLASAAMFTMAGTNMLNLIKGLGNMGTASTGALTAITKLGIYAASFGVGYFMGTWLVKNVPLVDEFATALADATLSMRGLDEKSLQALETTGKQTESMGAMRVAMVKLLEEQGKLPAQQTTDVLVKGTDEYLAQTQEILEMIQAVPETKNTDLTVKADSSQIKRETDKIYEVLPSGEKIEIAAVIRADKDALDKTKEEIDKLPEQKILEIKLRGEIDIQLAEIAATADILQSKFEWEAKLDIAEIEAAFAALEATAASIGEMFVSTGDVIIALASLLGDPYSQKYADIMRLMEEENRRRDELLLLEKSIAEAEIAFLNAKTEALEAGQGLITISAEGVYPELELVLFKIIELAQIKANEEGLEYLLGT